MDKTDAHNRIAAVYFQEVGRYPLPTPDQEKALFQAYEEAIRNSKIALRSSVRAEKCLTNASTARKRTLWTERRDNAQSTYRGWEKARIHYEKTIPCGYLRFVIQEALRRTRDDNLLKELISAGNLGLMVAVKKFRWRYGNRFLTYAAWWIRVYMQEHLHHTATIHVPNHTRKDKQHSAEDTTPAYIDPLFRSEGPMMSSVDLSTIPDDSAPPDAELSAKEINTLSLMEEAGLPTISKLVLIYSFGLRGGPSHTLDDVSQILYEIDGTSLAPDAIRQVRNQALAGLKVFLSSKEKSIHSAESVF